MPLSHLDDGQNLWPTYAEHLYMVGIRFGNKIWAYTYRIHKQFNIYLTY